MTTVCRGRVFTGIGIAKARVQQNLEVYKQVTGIDLIPGTLNVRLAKSFEIPVGCIYVSREKFSLLKRTET